MELRHEFTVPVAVGEAWKVLLDIERVAPCMPGATVEGVEGDTVKGAVKVKVGPITVTYRGTAVFEEKDEEAHRIVLSARGKEVRGQGTARATVTGTLAERDGGTVVSVLTDLAITGRPAQFGRGVMAEVGDKIIGQFADCLSGQLAGAGAERARGAPGEEPVRDGTGGPGTGEGRPGLRVAEPPAPGPYPAEPIDLIRAAGLPVAKRTAAAALVLAALAALVVVITRRRR